MVDEFNDDEANRMKEQKAEPIFDDDEENDFTNT